MSIMNQIEEQQNQALEEPIAEDLLLPLVLGHPMKGPATSPCPSVIVGELIGMKDGGRTPLVLYPKQPGSAAIEARSVVDLHDAHIGRQVALVFEGADPAKPIVVGVLRASTSAPLSEQVEQARVDVDGDHLVVTAVRQLILRCGDASITLTKEGKIVIRGTYLSIISSGVNRIKGGSVEIN